MNTEDNTETLNVERSIGRLEGKLDSIMGVVGSTRGEVKSLRDDFATMEKGRLSRLEISFATLETTVQLKAKNAAILWASGMSLAVSVISALALAFLLK